MKRQNAAVCLAGAIVSFAMGWSARGDVLYVDQDATGPTHDGASWCSAYADLQDGLAAALAGDEIRVANGVYTPDRGTGDRTATFRLKSQVVLAGGYAGCGAAQPDARDTAIFETVLRGDLNGDDGPDFANYGDNSYHVVTYDDPDATGVVLDGFTVMSGYADGTSPPLNQGPGIHIRDNSRKCIPGGPTIRNCVIEKNWAAHHGAVNDHALATVIETCTFRDNFAGHQGGGLLINHGTGTIVRDCTFERNVTDNEGGGVWAGFDADVTCLGLPAASFTGCRFKDNEGLNGGGFFAAEYSSPVLSDCAFEGNVAASQGGGLHLARGPISVNNTTFVDNLAAVDGPFEPFAGGGGAWLGTGVPSYAGVFTDCEFRGNIASRGGGIFARNTGSLRVTRGRFETNVALLADGGGIWYNVPAVVTDSTFLRNQADQVGGALSADRRGVLTLTRSWLIENRVVQNVAGGGGGGMALYDGFAAVANCWFVGNSSPASPGAGLGGGGMLINGAVATIANAVLMGNSARGGGGAVFSNGAQVVVANSTFANNTAAVDGDAIATWSSSVNVVNSILWDDAGDSGIELSVRNDSQPSVEHTCIRGGWSGSGNFDSDPRFQDAFGSDGIAGTADDDLRLRPDSPCIDTGDNGSLPRDATDLDGDGDTTEVIPVDIADNSRILGAVVDMGAFERGDCNNNGISDSEDIASGTSRDCDGNGLPDECQPDCNANGVADSCESDRDEDGTIDDCDLCPDDSGKVAPGQCGCGVSDDDADNDTVADCNDICPGANDLIDSDGDGVPDGCDSCNGADDSIDCNHNGYSDPCEVLDGVAEDADANGVPDECDIAPAVAADACRALVVTPPSGAGLVALRLSATQVACFERYITPEGGLTDTPVYLPGDEWGTVIVIHEEIVPAVQYAVEAHYGDGIVSAQTWATTAVWGDVIGATSAEPPDGFVNFRDIAAEVDCFKALPTAVPLYRCDIHPATPDGFASFADIDASVRAYKSLPYPYPTLGPCP